MDNVIIPTFRTLPSLLFNTQYQHFRPTLTITSTAFSPHLLFNHAFRAWKLTTALSIEVFFNRGHNSIISKQDLCRFHSKQNQSCQRFQDLSSRQIQQQKYLQGFDRLGVILNDKKQLEMPISAVNLKFV